MHYCDFGSSDFLWPAKNISLAFNFNYKICLCYSNWIIFVARLFSSTQENFAMCILYLVEVCTSCISAIMNIIRVFGLENGIWSVIKSFDIFEFSIQLILIERLCEFVI